MCRSCMAAVRFPNSLTASAWSPSWPRTVPFGELMKDKFTYYLDGPREPFRNRGRITDLIASSQLFNDIGQTRFLIGGLFSIMLQAAAW